MRPAGCCGASIGPARRTRAQELLAAIGADIDPEREAGTLSMPEQQLVEIAKALGANVQVLILDEPTASLTERETERLFGIIRRLRDRRRRASSISRTGWKNSARIADRDHRAARRRNHRDPRRSRTPMRAR